MADSVRVCLTRCPLPPAEQHVHSLPCRIHHDGPAAIKTYFHPTPASDPAASADGKPKAAASAELRAEFRGIQLQGDKVDLKAMGLKGKHGHHVAASLVCPRVHDLGEPCSLCPMRTMHRRTAGFLLEDSGLRHADDDGRIWEVEHHFDELTWWCVPI